MRIEHSSFRGVPRDLPARVRTLGSPETYLLGSGLLGDFCQSDITSFGQLSPEEECALSKRGCTELLGF